MKDKPTQFAYVYDRLKGRILSGQIQAGCRLPSMRKLCSEFQVSIRTIIDVLGVLKEEGFLTFEPRKPALVCYKDESDTLAVQSVLSRRDELTEIFRTKTLLLPPLLAFSMQYCKLEKLPHYEQALKIDRSSKKSSEWQLVFLLLRDILTNTNPQFGEMYSALDQQAWINFFLKGQENTPSVASLLNMLQEEDPREVCAALASLFQNFESSANKNLERLSSQHPGFITQEEPAFEWNVDRKCNYYYMHLVQDIIEKIGLGKYPLNEYIPHEHELAKQYDVCIATVRKALSKTARLGFTKTLNAKGTIAMLPDPNTISVSLREEPVQKMYTMRYLYTLQFMAFVTRAAARLSAPNFTTEDMRMLSELSSWPETLPIHGIIRCIEKHLTLQPLKAILNELRRSAHWGYYFSVYNTTLFNTFTLRKTCQDSIACLEAGNITGFANETANCYCIMLETNRNFISERFGLEEAQNVRTPDKSLLYIDLPVPL